MDSCSANRTGQELIKPVGWLREHRMTSFAPLLAHAGWLPAYIDTEDGVSSCPAGRLFA
jgi:hypothetical protein